MLIIRDIKWYIPSIGRGENMIIVNNDMFFKSDAHDNGIYLTQNDSESEGHELSNMIYIPNSKMII